MATRGGGSYVNMEAQQRPMSEEASWVKGDVSMETIKGGKHTKTKDAAVLNIRLNIVF